MISVCRKGHPIKDSRDRVTNGMCRICKRGVDRKYQSQEYVKYRRYKTYLARKIATKHTLIDGIRKYLYEKKD